MPELKINILNFGYGVNFKYKGMLSAIPLTDFMQSQNLNYPKWKI